MNVPEPKQPGDGWWIRLRAVTGAAVTLGGIALVLGCATPLPPVDADLTPAEFFQAAQEATVDGKYTRAMRYYEVYRERYGGDSAPGQSVRLLWADYEIAFLHHKMGDDETARELLRALIRRYQEPEAIDYPPAPRIMALRVIAEIEGSGDGPQAP